VHLAGRRSQTEGYIGLAGQVVEEVERILNKSGPAMARWVFNQRRQQLSRMNPRYFGDRVSMAVRTRVNPAHASLMS
jgi:hypothetical protein